MSFPPFPTRRLRRLLLPLLIAALGSASARADEAADIARLAQAGRGEEALKRLDAVLGRQPADIQMRFMKGVMLSETRPAEAIAIFTRLTQDYPKLPEPYNNLAVLYAAAGQYEKARAALDRAMRTSPAYATAFDNLGDVHARLASQAYDKALQIDSGATVPTTRLALVRSLGVPAGQPALVAVAPLPKPVAPAPVVVAAAPTPAAVEPSKLGRMTQPAPVEAPKAVIEEHRQAKAVPQPEQKVVVAKSEPAKAEPAKVEPAKRPPAPVEQRQVRLVKAEKPDPKVRAAQEAAAEKDAVLNAVESWAKAWSAQDVPGYLAHYASDFAPPGGLTRKAWMEERQARITGKGRIKVSIDKPQVSTEGNTATVRFRQSYVSDRLSASSRKTLELERQRGKWLIRQERTG